MKALGSGGPSGPGSKSPDVARTTSLPSLSGANPVVGPFFASSIGRTMTSNPLTSKNANSRSFLPEYVAVTFARYIPVESVSLKVPS